MQWRLVLGLSCLCACTDAQFGAPPGDGGDACVEASCTASRVEDGGAGSVDSERALDTGVAPDARVEPAAALLGTYAVHTRFYGRELTTGLVEALHELIVIADITRTPAGLQMRATMCEDSGHLLTAGLRTDVRVKYPEKFPVRTFGLVVEGSSFHTTDDPFPIGYTREWPTACTPGARIASSNRWSGGTCSCVEGSDAPKRADDCRVVDSDEDNEPGMTVQSGGLVTATQSVRIRDRSQYVFGVIDEVNRRHRANYQKDEDLQELGCSNGDCPSYAGRFCPISTQLVTFVPLADAGITCSEVLRQVDSNLLFAGERLDGSFPAGC